jgi:hypothetical protein
VEHPRTESETKKLFLLFLEKNFVQDLSGAGHEIIFCRKKIFFFFDARRKKNLFRGCGVLPRGKFSAISMKNYSRIFFLAIRERRSLSSTLEGVDSQTTLPFRKRNPSIKENNFMDPSVGSLVNEIGLEGAAITKQRLQRP